jgi:hypothetical protein
MRLLLIIIVISIIGNLVAVFLAYKYLKTERQLNRLTQSLIQTRTDYNNRYGKHLLFIHHSVGENMLFEGGLKDSLEKQGIGVHSVTYGNEIGQNTDMCDWAAKFKTYYLKMTKYDIRPNILYPDGRENDIILFKSCFPNSDIITEGTSPGDPFDKTKTVWNYKAVIEKLGREFSNKPGKLFIYMTAPPIVPSQTTAENAARAREFNNWLITSYSAEYRENYRLSNFLIFNLYDILADQNGFLREEFRRSESDSHPNAKGSIEASRCFMQFLRENGIIESEQKFN